MEAPRLKSMFKQKKPNGFEYKPRYYDARKEKMEERYDRIKNELGQKKPISLKKEWKRKKSTQRQVSKKIIIYILFLVALTYWILK